MDWEDRPPRHRPSQEEIKESKRAIAELDLKIAALTAELKRLSRARANRVAFIAPLHRLPQELLCDIIKHSMENGTRRSTLIQINSLMRAAVNGMRTLWTRITLPPSKKLDDWSGHHCSSSDLLPILLSRAAPLPLELYIQGSPQESAKLLDIISESEPPYPVGRLILALRKTSGYNLPRLNLKVLRYLDLEVDPDNLNLYLHLLDHLEIDAPNGLHLYLFAGDDRMAYPILGHPALAHLTRLEWLFFENVDSPPFVLSDLESLDTCNERFLVGIQCHKLRNLAFKGLRLPKIPLHIDSLPTSLESLDISDCRLKSNNIQTIVFENLTSVHLDSACITQSAFGKLYAPHLKELAISSNRIHRDDCRCEDGMFFDRGMGEPSSLKQLTFDRCIVNEEYIRQMTARRNLEHIKFEYCRVYLDWFTWIYDSEANPSTVLPALEELHFHDSPAYEEDDWSDFLARCKKTRPSLRIIIEFGDTDFDSNSDLDFDD